MVDKVDNFLLMVKLYIPTEDEVGDGCGGICMEDKVRKVTGE